MGEEGEAGIGFGGLDWGKWRDDPDGFGYGAMMLGRG